MVYGGLFDKESTAGAGEVFLRIEHNFPKEDAADKEGPGRQAYTIDYYFVAKSGHDRFEIAISDPRTHVFPKSISIDFRENSIYKLEGTDIQFKMIKLIDNSITYQLIVSEDLKDKIRDAEAAASGGK